MLKKCDILNALSTDHSPVFCSISKRTEFNKDRGKGLWKFNKSVISNTDLFCRPNETTNLKY